jgi:NAD(P)H-hydrate repair Nnr-like enzyme with NAD(P)H-hydrate epimerase domain
VIVTSRVPTFTATQVRAAERPLLEAGEPLMLRAASALAAIVRERLQDAASPRARPRRQR